ncbi:rRNA small subunit pseudouridine methyltransferase Nep1 [Ranunculus cassubicifolius]
MVRPYAVKGKKRKKTHDSSSSSSYKAEQQFEPEDEQLLHQQLQQEPQEEQIDEENEKIAHEAAENLPGIPITTTDVKHKGGGVIFILEKASLEVAKVGKSYQILTSDDHANFIRKNKRDPADYRPDIAHQALLAILDSPLNKAGKLRAVYVRTEKGVLFEVLPHVRIPRTPKRFYGIMLQLLQKLSITATNKREKLLRVIKHPVTQHLPINSRKIGLSHSSDKLVKLPDYVAAANDDETLVFVVGAMSHGKIDQEYTDDFISVSDYPLSAANCISRICYSLELKWNIV